MGAEDLVIGIDSSTQSAKAVAWNLKGQAIAEGRAPIAMNMPICDHMEQNIDDWWQAAKLSLNALWENISPQQVIGISISNQRETIGFIDENDKEIHPAITWLDQRAREDVKLLVDKLGAENIHRISGKPIDLTPCIYRLNWLQRNAPEILKSTAKIIDVHGYLSYKLTDRLCASHTSADPFGIFDIHKKEWSEFLFNAVGIQRNQLPEVLTPGEKIGGITSEAAKETGLLEGTPLFAGGGDGQSAGLGVNATRKGVAYLNLGTAVITGAWSKEAEIGKYWRTMTSPTGEGYFLEAVQRAGTFFIDWYIDNFAGGREDTNVFASLEEAAKKIPIGTNGLLCSPYLSGCMDPHWDANARASFIGLTPAHGKADLYRACLEGLTLTITQAIEEMAKKDIKIEEIYAVGGGANNMLWRQMIADASGLPVSISRSNEASALGAGIIAAVGCGIYKNFDEAANAMSRIYETTKPDREKFVEWQILSKRHAKIYQATKSL